MSNTINGAGVFTNSYSQALTRMRKQFDDLNLQLATGKKSQTYGGLGVDRGLSLTLRGKLSALDSYKMNIQQASLRTSLMMTSLTTLTDIASQTRGDLDPSNYILIDGKRTIAQQSALTRLETALEALNTDSAGVYLFGGRSVTSKPVASADDILDGIVGRAGLRTVMAERKDADLGADGRGRLTLNVESSGAVLTPAQQADMVGAGAVAEDDTLEISVNGAAPVVFTIGTSGLPEVNTLDDLVNAINSDVTINGDITASNVNGQLRIAADDNDVTFAFTGAGATALGIADPGYDPDTMARLSEDAVGVFGFKLVAGETDIAGATVSGLTGTPPHLDFTLTAQPEADDTIRFALELPDGSFEDITLRATTTTPPGSNQFTIGATLDATMANIRSAMDTAIQDEAETTLVAASALTASRNFFGEPPMRVDGSPATATGLVDGTATTIDWYLGESGVGSARPTQSARIDSTINAEYGARANEDGIRTMIENLAGFAAMELDTADEQVGKAQYGALVSRIRPELASETGLGPLEGVVTEITNVAASIQSATKRHQQSESVLQTMLENVEGVSKEEVAASILALQTNLAASYQVTAMAAQLTLVNFMGN
jgi:flagellin-like hook-associated protein FlgL